MNRTIKHIAAASYMDASGDYPFPVTRVLVVGGDNSVWTLDAERHEPEWRRLPDIPQDDEPRPLNDLSLPPHPPEDCRD